MSGVKDSLFLKSSTTTASAISTDLKLHWDTTQTSGSGSTGTLTALAGSATGDMLSSGDVDKTNSSDSDSAGNQGWKFLSGASTTNTQLRASQSFATILGSNSTNYTVEIWARIDSKQASDSVFHNTYGRTNYSAYSTAQGYIIGLYGAGGTGLHQLVKSDTDNTYDNIGSALTYGSFAQYVLTAGGSSGSLQIKNYLNGSLDGTANINGNSFVSDGDFLIGGRYAYSNKSWNGVFRICRLYSKALTAAEVLNNFNAEKAKFGL